MVRDAGLYYDRATGRVTNLLPEDCEGRPGWNGEIVIKGKDRPHKTSVYLVFGGLWGNTDGATLLYLWPPGIDGPH